MSNHNFYLSVDYKYVLLYSLNDKKVELVTRQTEMWVYGGAYFLRGHWLLLYAYQNSYYFEYRNNRFNLTEEGVTINFKDGSWFSEFEIKKGDKSIFQKKYLNIQGLRNPFIDTRLRDSFDQWFSIYESIKSNLNNDYWKRLPARWNDKSQDNEFGFGSESTETDFK